MPIPLRSSIRSCRFSLAGRIRAILAAGALLGGSSAGATHESDVVTYKPICTGEYDRIEVMPQYHRILWGTCSHDCWSIERIFEPEIITWEGVGSHHKFDCNLMTITSTTLECSDHECSRPEDKPLSVALDLRNMQTALRGYGERFTTDVVTEAAIECVRESCAMSTLTLNVNCLTDDRALLAPYSGPYPPLSRTVLPDSRLTRDSRFSSPEEFRMCLLACRPSDSRGYLALLFTPKEWPEIKMPTIINRVEVSRPEADSPYAYVLATARYNSMLDIQGVLFQLRKSGTASGAANWEIVSARRFAVGREDSGTGPWRSCAWQIENTPKGKPSRSVLIFDSLRKESPPIHRVPFREFPLQ